LREKVFQTLVEDGTAGDWLFTNRDGEPMKAIKKGFAAACERAKIKDLRPYDLRHTFATRLVERGIHHFVISALLGHATPLSGFGHMSRMTPGYAHVTWEVMVAAVEALEHPATLNQNKFANASGENQPPADETRKAG